MDKQELPDWVPEDLRGAIREEMKASPGVYLFLQLLDGKTVSQRDWLACKVGAIANRAQVWQEDLAIDTRTGARTVDLFRDEPIDRIGALRIFMAHERLRRRDWEEPMSQVEL